MASTTTSTASETTARPAADYGHGHFSSIGHGHGVVDRLRQAPAAGAAARKAATVKLAVDEMAAKPVTLSLQVRPKPISIFPPRRGQPCQTTAAQRMAAYRQGAQIHDAKRAAFGVMFVS